MSRDSQGVGQQVLATVVFTDVVAFSRRVEQSETHTLELVRRDLALISESCAAHNGEVMKNTGDGLLMVFKTAEHAVRCGLAVQEALAKAATDLPPEDVLQHRIAIHLGDVFVSSDDVMGEGVNVAARLLGAVEAGGICFSQTVYDVVKHRLGIRVTYLGARELKNIRESVGVYQILLDAMGRPSTGPSPEPTRGSWASSNYKLIAGAAVVLLAIISVPLVAHWKAARPAASAVTSAGAGMGHSATTQSHENATVLYQTGFKPPVFHPGTVVGQNGWAVGRGCTEKMAQIISSGTGQHLCISGPEIKPDNSKKYYGAVFRPVPYDPLAAGNPRIAITATLRFELGPTASQADHVFAFLTLCDLQGAPVAAIGVDKVGSVFGQNFDNPNVIVRSEANGADARHTCRIGLDFANRTARFSTGGNQFGMVPFNPRAGAMLGSVRLVLQSTDPIDSTLWVDHLSVEAMPSAARNNH